MIPLILPTKFKGQPQTGLELAPEYKNSAMLFSIADFRNLVPGNDLTSAGPPSTNFRETGKTLTYTAFKYTRTTNNISTGTAFTVFAWVRPSSLNSSYTRIMETDYGAGFYLGSNTGTKYALIIRSSANEGCIGGQQVVGQRDFVCGVWDGTNMFLYINGIKAATSTTTNPTLVSTITIGANAGNPNANNWNGDIDTIGLFTRAFPDSEVWAIYQDPWRMLKRPTRRLWTMPSSGSFVLNPSGGITLSGTNNLIKTKVIAPSGAITFAGSAPLVGARTYVLNPSGGISFSKTNQLIKTRIQTPTGGIIFNGSAPITSNTVVATVNTRLPLTGVGI